MRLFADPAHEALFVEVCTHTLAHVLTDPRTVPPPLLDAICDANAALSTSAQQTLTKAVLSGARDHLAAHDSLPLAPIELLAMLVAQMCAAVGASVPMPDTCSVSVAEQVSDISVAGSGVGARPDAVRFAGGSIGGLSLIHI